MKIFDLVNNKINFDSSLLIVPEFKNLWDKDKTKTKDYAFKQFAYIYFICDSNSPYSNFPEDKRKEIVGKDMFKDEIKINSDLLEAIKKYNDLSESPTQRLLSSVKSKIDGVATFLNNTDINEDSLVSVLKAIESTSKLVSQLATLEDAVNKEKATDSTRRAGEKRTRKYED